MKQTNWLKYAPYMRAVIEAKCPEYSVVWLGENNFVLVKDGTETRIQYE